MTEKTINGMRRDELITLIKEIISEINTIHETSSDILEKKRVLDEGNFVASAEQAHSEVVDTLGEIKKYHKEIFEGDDESDAIKSKIDGVLNNLLERRASTQRGRRYFR